MCVERQVLKAGAQNLWGGRPQKLKVGSCALTKGCANYLNSAPLRRALHILRHRSLSPYNVFCAVSIVRKRLHKKFCERHNSPFLRMYKYTGPRYEVWEMQFSCQGRNEGESMFSPYEDFQNKGVRSQGRINPLSVISDVERIRYTGGLKLHVIASATIIPRASQRTSVV